MKYKMDVEQAKRLIKKITADTKSGVLEWEKAELSKNIEVKEEFQVPLTAAKEDYHFQAVLKDTAVAHLQMQGEQYYFWVESEGDIAQLEGSLYRSPELSSNMIDLAFAIHEKTKFKLKNLIEDYLEDK